MRKVVTFLDLSLPLIHERLDQDAKFEYTPHKWIVVKPPKPEPPRCGVAQNRIALLHPDQGSRLIRFLGVGDTGECAVR